MNALIYSLHLLQPLLATQTQVSEPNSASSLNYVPGSMVRGALVALYRQTKADKPDPAALYKLFLSGAVRFLNAYPEGQQAGQRMLPKPLSWFTDKQDLDNPAAPIYDFACALSAIDAPKSPPGDFVCSSSTDQGRIEVALGEPAMQLAVHIASDDRNRKLEGQSQVYQYEALAAGQTLIGVILAETLDDLAEIAKLVPHIHVLGGSRTGGYGRVNAQVLKASVTGWTEHATGVAKTGPVIISLLSDAIVRDSDGQFDVALAAALQPDGPQPKLLNTFYRLRLVGGFNRTWGLPLPQAWAIAAGSVFVFERTPALLAALPQWIAAGVGERTAEGFGRLAVDWQTAATFNRTGYTPVQRDAPPVRQLTPASTRIAQTMANRKLVQRLEAATIEQLTALMPTFDHLPSPAQLARARLAARRAYDLADLTVVKAHFDSLKTARAAWAMARIEGKPALDWINSQISLNDAAFRTQFGLQKGVPAVAKIRAEVTLQLQARTIARLLESLMRQAMRSQKQEAPADEETQPQ